MDILGKVSGGVVVLEDSNALPDGTVVRVEPVEAAEPAKAAEQASEAKPEEPAEGGSEGPSLYESLRDVIGIIKDGPPDWAENHDHYLYGTPKKTK